MYIFRIAMATDWKGRSIISLRDFDKKDVDLVLQQSKKMDTLLQKHGVLDAARGKVLATLFFEPSTRTRLSFETAMSRLGGKVIGFSGTEGTSVSKGETLSDTIQTAARYSDVMVMRHPLEGSARRASEISPVPVINGGDGANQHPTQTLLDLYTILKSKGRIGSLAITMVGDLKYSRTVHSLGYALAMFKGVKLNLVSPKELRMPSHYVDELSASMTIRETENLASAVKDSDIVYVTRIQRERFPDPQEYEQLKGSYVINRSVIARARKGVMVMHPLPRVDEISTGVDSLEQAAYFEQARNSIPVRMALLKLVMGV